MTTSVHAKRLAASRDVSTESTLEERIYVGQIVRRHGRYTNMTLLDIRIQSSTNTNTQLRDTHLCSCCTRITVSVTDKNLMPSYGKHVVKLGDVIQLRGTVSVNTESKWYDFSQVPADGDGVKLREARLMAKSECVLVESFKGKKFIAEPSTRKTDDTFIETEVETVCKVWINSGGKCALGDKCRFSHPALEQVKQLRQAWVADRVSKRLRKATEDWDDSTEMSLKKPHSARASVFADWLLKHFGGVEALNKGSGVYDIAGGSGRLSLALIDRNIAKCTVIDSREFSLGFVLRRWIKRRQRKSKKLDSGEGQDAGNSDGEQNGDSDQDEDDDEGQHEQASATNAHATQIPTTGTNVPSTGPFAKACASNDIPFKYIQQLFSIETVTQEMRNASLFVGMHPDQATGAIVETAIQCNVPFAVVPCCVFKDEFPDRRLRNGEQVCTTLDLVQWIKEKKPDGVIKTDFLDIQGKNMVVYWTNKWD
ncbi:hypothetical protein CcCBS67573_g07394 [Chytriomyces confervae]|uniref:C3H1-type domain-containing protein n=1 Tax=Chytriomyces confervae TaxID=246404 RepID=A0A507EUP6_9FUNG|nr:hypothetical protein CcCBS67573_g07394 [Chytriomyces confervae]